MGHAEKTYIDVLLPVSLPGTYTYHLAADVHPEKILPGMRVLVQFGKRKIHTGLIVKKHNTPPLVYETKEILDIVDEHPVVLEWQIGFWQWISEYYMCNPGEVFNAALPAGFKLESQTSLYATTDAGDENPDLTDSQRIVLGLISDSPGIFINTIDFSDKKGLMRIVRQLVEKKLVSSEESVNDNFRYKQKSFIRLNEKYADQDRLSNLMDRVERRAPKQTTLLMAYLQLSGFLSTQQIAEVERETLLERSGTSLAILQALVDKEVFIVEKKDWSRLQKELPANKTAANLSPEQTKALQSIKVGFENNDICLLHGVTSSGKTEIYIHLIEEAIGQGKQVLYLVPEIALTTQIIERLRIHFGNKVGVYHSRFSDAERVEVWNNLIGKTAVNEETYQIILGVRSSVFLPFSNLGLVIVDEEHENTFKQFDPAPRYHARDASIVMALRHKAKVLLGTATPSIESYANAQAGKYHLVELFSRYKDVSLPAIEVVDMLSARKKNALHGLFSEQLQQTIKNALDDHEQVILFQNRRGYAPILECSDCGWIPECQHCDVSLTYHKRIDRLKCHYCGYSIAHPRACKACGSLELAELGFGTEKIEDEVKEFFPDKTIARLDLDTTRTRKAYENIITDFAQQKVDILIGTQMISKGLDFENVRIVGILNADNMLNHPDFRAYERSFQLMVQVSGRAGRKGKQGKVVIQTTHAKNRVIHQVIDTDYAGMFQSEMSDRKKFLYPPYVRLIKLTIKHKKPEITDRAADLLAKRLSGLNNVLVIGPEYPPISRMQGLFQKCIWLKVKRDAPLNHLKKAILQVIQYVKTTDGLKSVMVLPDVDPY